MKKAIIGKKVGMAQIFDENGKVIPVTVIEAGPCVVVQKKTAEGEGYDSVQLAFDDTLEEVQFLSITYSGDGAADYEGAKVYTVQVYAGDNDIYIENKTMMEELIDQNYCMPLDTFEGFEEFTRRHPEVEVLYAVPGANQADGKESTDEDAPVEEPRPYALNISTLKGFAERGALNMKDKYAAVVIMSKNQETSFEVLSAMFDALAPSEEAVS